MIGFNRIAVLMVLWLAGMAQASGGEIRVLLSFDNAGHHVRQVVRDNSENVSVSQQAKSDQILDIASILASLQPSVAMLVWTDERGRLQSSTTEPDPRITHAPAHIDGADGSRIGEQTGAWLVSGPDSATNLTILLPADPSLGLGFERWEVSVRGR